MTRLSADDRFALASAAANAERANRPRHLLAAGAAVLAVGAVVAGAGLFAERSANAELGRARRDLRRVGDAAASLLAAQRAGETTGEGFPPAALDSASFLPRMEALAKQAGITGTLNFPQDRTESPFLSNPEITRRFFTYTVGSDSLPNLMAWVESAVREVPGLYVAAISVESRSGAWQLTVTFARWERRTQQ